MSTCFSAKWAHELRLSIGPAAFVQRRLIAPIDQQAAIAAGAAIAQATPDWQYFGPFTENTHLSADERQSILDSQVLTRDDVTYVAHDVPLRPDEQADGYRWLSPLTQAAPDQPFNQQDLQALAVMQSFKPSTIYAISTYHAPSDGHLLIHASADYFMQWWINGEEILSTNTTGNRAGPNNIGAHTILAPVTAGSNSIIVRIQCGSKGIGMGSRWSFITDTTEDQEAKTRTPTSVDDVTGRLAEHLSEQFPLAQGVRPIAASPLIAPQFRFTGSPKCRRRAMAKAGATGRYRITRHSLRHRD